MKISVIIVTRDRAEDVRVSLKGFLAQTYTNMEIIVLDNQSTDGTREMMASEFPDIKYMWLPDNFDIRTINIGIEMSTGDIIWRTDSDSHPESPDTFKKIVDIFEKHPEIAVIASEDIEVRQGNKPWEWYPLPVDKVNVPDGGYPANLFPGTGAAIRREVFDDIGGFWGFGFEEIEFCTRAIVAGYNVRYFPQIRTLHYASPRDRDNPNRWIMMSKQHIRYTWRYFPFFRAMWRSSIIYSSQVLSAIMQRLPILAIIQGIIGMQESALNAFRNERKVVPKDKLYDITLGVGVGKTQMRFFGQKFLRLFKRVSGK